MGGSFNLQRFIDAQNAVYSDVVGELTSGRKKSHWMWFIFPQLRALGQSTTAKNYGLVSMDEARAYWEHGILSSRLAECTGLMLAVEGKSARNILGSPDDLKFRSCMTLFEVAAPGEPLFRQALKTYYADERDQMTLDLLSAR